MSVLTSGFIAEHRFGYGPKAGSMTVRTSGREGLLAQLKQRAAAAPEFANLKPAKDLLPILKTLRWQMYLAEGEGKQDVVKELKHEYDGYYLAEIAARFRLLVTTETPFFERLVWFWSNHFTVSGERHVIMTLLGPYEREALRPHIMGTFAELLKSAVRHPAMIMYLDNQMSVNPYMGDLRRKWRQRLGFDETRSPTGINENLAREILELHTLGVDGGYTQGDITRFAHVLTGWRVYQRDSLINRLGNDSASDNGTGFRFASIYMMMTRKLSSERPMMKKTWHKVLRCSMISHTIPRRQAISPVNWHSISSLMTRRPHWCSD